MNGGFAKLVAGRPLSVTITGGLSPDAVSAPKRRRKAVLQSYELRIDDEPFLRLSADRTGRLQLDELTPAFLGLLVAEFGDPGPVDTAEVHDAAARLFLLPRGLSAMRGYFSPPSRGSDDERLVHILYHVLAEVQHSLKAELSRLSYLGPLRSYPPRHIAFADHDDPHSAAGGGRAWNRLRRSKALRDAVNVWLGSSERLQTRYRLALDRFVAPKSAQGAVGAALDEVRGLLEAEDDEGTDASGSARWDRDRFVKLITNKLEADGSVEGAAALVLVDIERKTTVSHRDVGIGISQVLPVLVEAYGNESRLVAIEQPEIHLHPRLQAELGDVFIEGALGPRRNTFLLETHSEHLLLRVMRRVRETHAGNLPSGLPAVRPEDIVVLYVIPDPMGARILEIPITEDGELGGPWPGGFFPERVQELL